MQIYEVLKSDHNKVKKILASMEKSKNRDLFEELKEEVTIHTELEEKIFYDPLQDKAGNVKIIVKGANVEHDLVDQMMKQLEKLKDDEEEEWQRLFAVIKKNLESHIKMEEDDMFSLAKAHFSSKTSQEMATQMLEEKEKLVKKR